MSNVIKFPVPLDKTMSRVHENDDIKTLDDNSQSLMDMMHNMEKEKQFLDKIIADVFMPFGQRK